MSIFARLRTAGPARRGLAAQLFSLGTILAIQLLQVPVYVGELGAATYGSYLLLIALPSALTLSDFGLLSATSTRLMGLVALRETAEAKRLSRFTNSVVVYSTSLIFVIAVLVVHIVDVSQPGISLEEARPIVLGYAFYAILFVYSSSFEGSMRAAGAYASAWVRLGVMRLVDFVAGASVLLVTHSLVLSVGGMVASRLVGLIALRVKVKAVAPWSSWALVWPNKAMAPGMLRPTIGSLALPVGNALINQGALIAVGAALGPVSVAAFSTVRTMVNVLRQLTGVVTNSTLPSLTKALSVGQNTEARSILRRVTIAVAVVSIGGAAGLAILGPFIVRVWTHGEIQVDASFIALLCAQAIVESTWLALSLWFLAQNRHFGYSIVFVFSAAAYVALLFLLNPANLQEVALTQIGCSALVLVWVIVTLRLDLKNDKPPTTIR